MRGHGAATLRTAAGPLLGLLLGVSGARALTYQVGPGKPYANLQAVAGLLNPGDLVEVDGNTSYTGGVVFTRPGSPSQKVTIRGISIGGVRPRIQGSTNTVHFSTPDPDVPAAAANHYVFENFEITGGTFRGIYHQAHDLTLRDVIVHDCPAHGILGGDQGSGSMLMERVEVHRCGNGTSQHQIYMATDEVHHPGSVFRMQHCYVHDATGGNNVKSRCERNEIYYNWIEGALYHELELIGPDPNGAPAGWSEGMAREDSDVVGNVLWQHNTFSITRVGGDGTGQSNGRYRFVNNTILAGTSAVFRVFDGIQSIEMHNNVLVRADGGSPVNVLRQVEAVWTNGEQIAGSSNWVRTGATNIPTNWTGTMSGTDPGFTNPAAFDLTPLAGSPLVGTANMLPVTPPTFPFPAPHGPAVMEPPVHAVAAARFRPWDCDLDVGAVERPSAPTAAYGLAFTSKTAMGWNGVPGATGYDVVKGDLIVLRQTGSFATSQLSCLEDGGTDLVATDAATPGGGAAWYYVVRSSPGGTYDSRCPSQPSSRDAGLVVCP